MGHQGSAATGSIANPISGFDSYPRPIITSLSQIPEGGSGSSYNRANREKATFLVCAGRYTIRANAERHLEALQKLGYSPKLKYDGQKEYWVVLKTVKGISKAEKIKTQFQKSGITCILEEE
jgi:cell division protein FtsN